MAHVMTTSIPPMINGNQNTTTISPMCCTLPCLKDLEMNVDGMCPQTGRYQSHMKQWRGDGEDFFMSVNECYEMNQMLSEEAIPSRTVGYGERTRQ